MYSYYAVLRPIGIGTVPQPKDNPIVKIMNFETRTTVESYPKPVWGMVEYEKPLTEKEIVEYELGLPGAKNWTGVYVRTDKETQESVAHMGATVLSVEEPQGKERSDEKKLVRLMWFESQEQAIEYVNQVQNERKKDYVQF